MNSMSMAEYEGDWKLAKFHRAATNSQSARMQRKQTQALTSVMRLHALQSVTEHSSAVKFNLAFPSDDRAIDGTPWPEMVVHAAPRLLGVCAVVAGTVLSAHEARGTPGELDVNQTAVVNCSLDCVR